MALAGTTVLSENQSAYGGSVSGAGDLDGDGYDDLIVGAPLTNSAFVYRGGALGVDPVAATVLTSTVGSAFFGARVAGVGDIDADGYADVMVGATNDGTAALHGGSAALYLGSPLGLSTVPAAVIYGVANQYLGVAIAPAGDIDGDGYDDLLIGGAGDPISGQPGGAWLYGGSASGQLTLIWQGQGAAASQYGSAVAAEDLDGDGYSELIVGAPDHGNDFGRVYVYAGSAAGVGVAPWLTLDGFRSKANVAANFGLAVSAVGDLDLDGYGDLVVVGENATGTGVHLFAGSAAGPVEVARVADWHASAAAAAGDVNGDGWPDLLVGSRIWNVNAGNAQVYLGSASGLAHFASRTLAGESNGMGSGNLVGGSVAPAGDVDGDGFGDLVVGGDGIAPGLAWVIGGRPDVQTAVGAASPGSTMLVDASSALPGDRVVVLVGLGGVTRGPCRVDLGGLCLSARKPSALGFGLADATGAVTVQVQLPPTAVVGSTLTVQTALLRDGGWLSAELSAPTVVVVGP